MPFYEDSGSSNAQIQFPLYSAQALLAKGDEAVNCKVLLHGFGELGEAGPSLGLGTVVAGSVSPQDVARDIHEQLAALTFSSGFQTWSRPQGGCSIQAKTLR